ncbi:MAG: Crp/Fnr family transcriptional regulator [Gemmatimonas sp.]
MPNTSNRLLAALPDAEYRLLQPHIEVMTLPQHQVLFGEGMPVRRGYFPLRGFISYVAMLDDGPIVETASIGPEGVAGAPLFSPSGTAPITAIAQMPCQCATIPARTLDDVMQDTPVLAALARRYFEALLAQAFQNVACNSAHSIEQRTAKWLLLSADRAQSDEFPLTQEFLGQMLGVSRQTVARAAAAFEDGGIITYRRGRVTITSRDNLMGVSCSCYVAIRDRYEAVMRCAG